MSDVNPKRPYRSDQRDKQAELTRQAVLDAAERMFRAEGWAPTTIAAVAREAGVSAETIYARFGNKRRLAHELVIRAMRGQQRQTPFMQQDARLEVMDQPDAERVVAAFAADISKLLARVAPILAVVRTAAESDAEMSLLYRELHKARRRNLGTLVETLHHRGFLRPDLGITEATDMVWSIVSPELWLLRADQLGSTFEDNRQWISDMLHRLLLSSEPRAGS